MLRNKCHQNRQTNQFQFRPLLKYLWLASAYTISLIVGTMTRTVRNRLLQHTGTLVHFDFGRSFILLHLSLSKATNQTVSTRKVAKGQWQSSTILKPNTYPQNTHGRKLEDCSTDSLCWWNHSAMGCITITVVTLTPSLTRIRAPK